MCMSMCGGMFLVCFFRVVRLGQRKTHTLRVVRLGQRKHALRAGPVRRGTRCARPRPVRPGGRGTPETRDASSLVCILCESAAERNGEESIDFYTSKRGNTNSPETPRAGQTEPKGLAPRPPYTLDSTGLRVGGGQEIFRSGTAGPRSDLFIARTFSRSLSLNTK